MYLLIVHHKEKDDPRDKQLLHFLAVTNLIFDSVGLAIFALIGASLGVSLHLNIMTSGILATLTGVGGGMLRDLFANEIPSVLREDVYAILAFLAGITYHFLVVNLLWPRIPVYLGLFVITLVVRLLVVRFDLNLPSSLPRTKENENKCVLIFLYTEFVATACASPSLQVYLEKLPFAPDSPQSAASGEL